MIEAIAIYSHDLRKEKFACKDKTQVSLFQQNPLADYEKIMLAEQDSITSLRVTVNQIKALYFYATKRHEFIFVIASKKRLDAIEIQNLFLNVSRVHYYGQKVRTTLDDIISNPLGYTGRDILIERTKQELAEARDLTLLAIDKVILRGEKLEVLLERTDHLQAEAIKFNKAATKINSCCRYG